MSLKKVELVENEPESLYERFSFAIEQGTAPKTISISNPDTILMNEFTHYDKYSKRSPKLDRLFDALCSVQPTSTQNERNFSLAGNFISKLRTRLLDKNVDALCFLKSHFTDNPK